MKHRWLASVSTCPQRNPLVALAPSASSAEPVNFTLWFRCVSRSAQSAKRTITVFTLPAFISAFVGSSQWDTGTVDLLSDRRSSINDECFISAVQLNIPSSSTMAKVNTLGPSTCLSPHPFKPVFLDVLPFFLLPFYLDLSIPDHFTRLRLDFGGVPHLKICLVEFFFFGNLKCAVPIFSLFLS